jgi:hypothetical protein
MFKAIDFIGAEYTLKFDQQKKIHSSFGGLVFVFFLISTLIYSGYILIELFNYDVRKYYTFNDGFIYEKLIIPKFSIGFYNRTDDTIIKYWKQYFEVVVRYANDSISDKYDFKPCNKKNSFNDINTNLYDAYKLDYSVCIDYKHNGREINVNFLNFEVIHCSNKTFSPSKEIIICKSEEEILQFKYKNDIVIGSFWETQQVNLKEPTSKKTIHELIHHGLNTGFQKQLIIQTAYDKILYDTGILKTKYLKPMYLPKIHHFYTDFTRFDIKKEKINYSIILEKSTIQTTFKIKNSKIQDTLHMLISFIYVSVFLANKIVEKGTRRFYHEKIIKDIFNITHEDLEIGMYGDGHEQLKAEGKKEAIKKMDRNDKNKIMERTFDLNQLEMSGRLDNYNKTNNDKSKLVNDSARSRKMLDITKKDSNHSEFLFFLKPSEKNKIKKHKENCRKRKLGEHLKLVIKNDKYDDKNLINYEDQPFFTTLELFSIHVCCCGEGYRKTKHKYKQYQKLSDISSFYMDGKYIANKIKDFSVFKHILLGETQLKLYNNIYSSENPLKGNLVDNPFVTDSNGIKCMNEKTNDENDIFRQSRNQNMFVEKLDDYYLKLKQLDRKTKSDERILNLYDSI